ncbi:connectin [Orussus abietinus]|uniref:connectin n=1 Tax=Orussus abietinus TaxID=222816 RepID=UPI000C715AAF|nr:connectin [Orussus abietinus]
MASLSLSVTLSASTRSRSKKKTKETKEINICDLERRETSVFCYCNNIQPRNATDANCWIFDRFEVDNPIWGHFTSQLYLEKLTFTVRQDGSITYVPTAVLKQLKNLHSVTFQYASIPELAERSFSNLSSISEINLSRNMIVVLRKFAFENMKNLTMVNLDENRIVEVNRDVFVGLPKLTKLSFNRNNISTLHDKAFKHLSTLLELELNGNQIAVITRDSFHGLRNLQKLDLRNNLLSMIGDRSFIEMPELRELELDQNKIEFISEDALEGMRNLKKLRLSENKLVSLEPDFLAGAPGVSFLNLRDNALRTMTFDNVKPIVTNLYNSNSYFYLDGNKLICDCKLAWIWGLRNETKNKKLRDTLEELTCFLESNNASLRSSQEAGNDQPLGAADRAEEYQAEKPRGGNEEDAYMGDGGEYYEYEEEYEDAASNSNALPKVEVVEGKVGYVRHLFDLKPEELPCPEPSREDLMASEQPSSHRDRARAGSSGSIFSLSSAEALIGSRSTLGLLQLLVVAIFT